MTAPAADATTATATGSATSLAGTPAVEKPGKKEKIRFGQAPREALPPAAHPTATTDQTGEAQVASNSSSSDISEEQAAPVERKTRFADRARQPKPKKVKTPDQVENERVAQQSTPEESAAEKTQSAPLGLAGDTAAKKQAPKAKGEKTRYSDEVNKSKQSAPAPAQPSTPSPLATPDSAPAPADNGGVPAPATTPAPAQPQP